MHFRFAITVFLTCFFCAFLNAQTGGGSTADRVYTFQDHHTIFGKNNVSLSFAPLLAGGLGANYDRRLIERHWIKLAPAYYRMQNYRDLEKSDMRQVQGYGFKLQHKYFPYANTNSKLGYFLSYGPTFEYFSIETHRRENLSFNKIGFECVIGARKVFRNIFYFEVYAGLATNYMQIMNDETKDWRGVLELYEKYWFEYGKTGNFITLGINVGVLF
jgi:hypothetical protein